MRLTKFFVIAVIGSLLVCYVPAACKMAATEDDDENAPAQVRAQAPVEKTAKVLSIDNEDQEKAGIMVASPSSSRHAGRVEAYGAVLPLQDLLELRQAYVTAVGKVQETQAEFEASSKEYERLKGLHQNDRNISDKTLQAADAKRRSDLAKSQTAQESVRIVKANLIHYWGKVIGEWILTNSASLDRLIRQDDFLIEITVSSGSRMYSPPQNATVVTPVGAGVAVKFISPSPRTDRRFQGQSFFYLASNRSGGLLPGMNVQAYLPAGPESEGFVIPASAVVWWQGKAWVYVRNDETHFIRREIPGDMPLDNGWFVRSGFNAKDLIAVEGAQLLLSEEFLKKTKSDED